MDKQLKNHIIDYIYHELKHENIEIVSITKNHNIFFDEMIKIVYTYPMTYLQFDENPYSYTMTSTCTIYTKELNEFISAQRNDKINSIL